MQSNSSVLALFSPQPAVEPTAPKADHGSDSDFNDFLSNANATLLIQRLVAR